MTTEPGGRVRYRPRRAKFLSKRIWLLRALAQDVNLAASLQPTSRGAGVIRDARVRRIRAGDPFSSVAQRIAGIPGMAADWAGTSVVWRARKLPRPSRLQPVEAIATSRPPTLEAAVSSARHDLLLIKPLLPGFLFSGGGNDLTGARPGGARVRRAPQPDACAGRRARTVANGTGRYVHISLATPAIAVTAEPRRRHGRHERSAARRGSCGAGTTARWQTGCFPTADEVETQPAFHGLQRRISTWPADSSGISRFRPRCAPFYVCCAAPGAARHVR